MPTSPRMLMISGYVRLSSLSSILLTVRKDLVREANEANEAERGMGFLKAIRTYPKAMAWSMILSSAIIMEG